MLEILPFLLPSFIAQLLQLQSASNYHYQAYYLFFFPLRLTLLPFALKNHIVGKQVSKHPCAPLTNGYRDRGSGRCIFLYIHIQAYASRCHEPLSNRFKHAMQTTGLTFVEIFILVSKLSVALRFQTCHIENVLSWFSMFIDNGVAATTHAYGESYEGWLQRHIATQSEFSHKLLHRRILNK